ncbi:MAG: hypothetical protein ACNA74_08585 [Desulfurivibrio sp.]
MQPSLNCFAFVRWGLALIVAVVLLGGCASRTVVESDLRIKGAPDWVNRGSQALNDRGGRLFHGVGSAPAMGDSSLQTSVADDRARAELARILSSYLQIVSREYLVAGGGAATEQAISRQIENVTRLNLSGSRIIGRWRDRRTEAVYALAELDMQQVKTTVEMVREMDEGLKLHVGRHADNIFDRMVEGEIK